jgi:hypothetical protein
MDDVTQPLCTTHNHEDVSELYKETMHNYTLPFQVIWDGGKPYFPPQRSIQSGVDLLVTSCNFQPWLYYP